jgi:hypothetical protein
MFHRAYIVTQSKVNLTAPKGNIMQHTRTSELESLQPTALDAGLVFSGKVSGRLIQGYDKHSAYTPAINPD